MTRRLASLLVLTIAPLLGCEGKSAAPEPLRVAAASDLQAALPILLARFRADTGVVVEPTFGASGDLARQVTAGAPFDLFLSANRAFVDDLAKAGSIRPDSVEVYARGTLVLVVGAIFEKEVASLADLAGPKVKSVAIANPDVAPYGLAARQALQKAGLWEAVRPKLAIAGTVRQALRFVESGNAEAGLVGRSIADVKGVKVIPLPDDAAEPILQAMGVVAGTRRADDAARFSAFLLSEDGQGILRTFGFRAVPSP